MCVLYVFSMFYLLFFFFFQGSGDHLDLHSFPTRRSSDLRAIASGRHGSGERRRGQLGRCLAGLDDAHRSEEHTSELQSRQYLVCRLLLEKKKKKKHIKIRSKRYDDWPKHNNIDGLSDDDI